MFLYSFTAPKPWGSWNRGLLRRRLAKVGRGSRTSTEADGVRHQRGTRSEAGAGAPGTERDLLAVDRGLAALLDRDPEMGRVARCVFYAGMTLEEAVTRMRLSPRTLRKRWARARAYLLETVEKNRYNP